MSVNLNDLKEAMRRLEELPGAKIITENPALPEVIRDATHPARRIIKEVIDLIEEEATLQLLVEQNKND